MFLFFFFNLVISNSKARAWAAACCATHVGPPVAQSGEVIQRQPQHNTKKRKRWKGKKIKFKKKPTDYSQQHVVQKQRDKNNKYNQFPRLSLVSEPFDQVKRPERI